MLQYTAQLYNTNKSEAIFTTGKAILSKFFCVNGEINGA